MITVWGRVSSSNVQATIWCLAELTTMSRLEESLGHVAKDGRNLHQGQLAVPGCVGYDTSMNVEQISLTGQAAS